MATASTASTASSTSSTSNSMLAGLDCAGNIHIVIGTNPLAASRCANSLSAGAQPILIAPETAELPSGLQRKIADGSIKWERKTFQDNDLFRLGREEVGRVADAVFVTAGPREELSVRISALCKRNRIPVNVVDAPHLCSFSLLATYADGPLQIGVTTNGRGCKLAARIRREIASSLPPNLGAACARLGDVRRRIQREDSSLPPPGGGDLDDSVDQSALFNKLVTDEDARNRRMRWLGQVCEYWPLKRLASVADEDVDRLLDAYANAAEADIARRRDSSSPGTTTGRIILAGSGPGHPDLLTRATYTAIQTADLVLADKLVPSGVLDLIPRRTPVHIARKFPGNADQAQEELLVAALEGARSGKTVLRLKQGDPYIYGRGGEELAYFREHGLRAEGMVTVLPGVTSALSAPLFAAIPPTQRDVADQVLVCTGTGKKGKPPAPPEYVASRTVVFLMALHRIAGLVRELTTALEDEPPTPPTPATPATPAPSSSSSSSSSNTGAAGQAARALWPASTPCAVIERASCPDQRVIRTTLAHVAQAIEAEGSRPPGLLVAGRSCEFLHPRDKGRAWLVEDGFRGLGSVGLATGRAASP